MKVLVWILGCDLGFGFTFKIKVLLTFESCSLSIYDIGLFCASFFLCEFEGLELI